MFKQNFFFYLLLLFAFNSFSSEANGNKAGAKIHNIGSDPIAHASRKSDKIFLTDLKKRYAGISDSGKIEAKLLQKQDYIELLNRLWSEPSEKKRLTWLEKNVDKQHPILLFEIAEEYYLRNPTVETYVLKTRPWLIAGMLRTTVDTVCTSDGSASVAPDFLLSFYSDRILENLLKNTPLDRLTEFFESSKEQSYENVKAVTERFLLPIVDGKGKNLPPPSWVFSHGMRSFTKEANAIPPSDWALLRMQKARQILEEIAKESDDE